MSIDIQESKTGIESPETSTIIDYEAIGLEIKEAMTKYTEVKKVLHSLGFSLSGNWSKKKIQIDHRNATGMTKAASLNVVATICKMHNLDFSEYEGEAVNCIGYISGFSDRQIRYGSPIEMDDCLIVTPYCDQTQTQPHSSHFLTPLADRVGTVSDIIGMVGEYQIIIPCGDMAYLEVNPWSKQIDKRESSQEQTIAYLYWMCFGSGNVDMKLLEKFVIAHKKEVENAKN